MRKKTAGVAVSAGHLEFVKLNAGKFDWRDAYQHILKLSWPQFAAAVLGTYVLLNVFFATLYTLGGACIAEMPPGSFLDAFFFSVETLATVGYGHMYPNTLYGHCVTTTEIMVGMFGLAVITGLIFVRFSRPTARIVFSHTAVIAPFDGCPNLMLRVANLRHHAMVEADFRIMLLRMESTVEGEEVRRFYPLRLQFDHLIAFPVALTLRHRIDETSPLFGKTADDLARQDVRLLASVVCTDVVIPAPVQSHTDYDHTEVQWHRRFVEIYTEQGNGRYAVDYARIHDTEPINP